MVSPVKTDFSIDTMAIETIVEYFVACGVKPFVLGTTGEAPSLSSDQKFKLVKTTAEVLNNRQPLLAGISNNSLFSSIEEGKKYTDLGVNALVSTVPNYYPLNDKQVLNWYEKLADSLSLPLFLYNIPQTTKHTISLDVIEKLSHHPNIIGVKDSEQNSERLSKSLKFWKHRDDFLFFVGWAAMSVFGIENGANGIVPSMGNLIPDLYQKLFDWAESGNIKEAEKIQEQTNVISGYCQNNRNISESIPAMKVLMAMKNLCGSQVLPPMVKMTKEEELKYRNEMKVRMEKL